MSGRARALIAAGLCAGLFAISCDLLEPNVEVLNESHERVPARPPWLIIHLNGGSRSLSPHIDADQGELRSTVHPSQAWIAYLANEEPERAHLELWSHAVSIERVTVSPGDPTHLVETAVEWAGASHTALIIAGEGRSWQGVGSDEAGEPLWDAEDLRALATSGVVDLFILDGGWLAHLELLTALAASTLVVAPAGPLDAEGVDYRAWAQPLAEAGLVPSAHDLAVGWSEAYAAATDSGSGYRAVIRSGEQIAFDAERLADHAAEISARATSAGARDELAATLLAAARHQAVPGPASIDLNTLDRLIGEREVETSAAARPPSPIVYLVELDALGRPSGVHERYRLDRSTALQQFAPIAPGWAPELSRGEGALYTLWYKPF